MRRSQSGPHPIAVPSNWPFGRSPAGASGLSRRAWPHLTGRRGSCRPAVSTGTAKKDRPSRIMSHRPLRPSQEACRSLRPRASGHR
jgi:hypothetical protein